MTDKELLELAAKAAGYEIEGDADKLVAQPGQCAGGFSILNDKGGSSLWNPLTDDGDALRLAVKLGLQIKRHYYEGDYFVDVPWDSMAAPKSESLKQDPYAATRRAIVRAAAEIEKGIK